VATWMELEIIILSEISQSTERQLPHRITHIRNLKSSICGTYTPYILLKLSVDCWLPDAGGGGQGKKEMDRNRKFWFAITQYVD
jgi:hypothetical protein